eukprot:227376-Prorocentrum_minimum.AAC.1
MKKRKRFNAKLKKQAAANPLKTLAFFQENKVRRTPSGPPLNPLDKSPLNPLWTSSGPPMDPLWTPSGPPLDPLWTSTSHTELAPGNPGCSHHW